MSYKAASRAILFFLLIFCVLSVINAEEEEYSDSFLATLPVDIRNSNLLELADWCRRLNLDSSGKRDALQRRLYSYYKLDYKPIPETKSKIVIQKAGLGLYEKVGEDAEYISLTGDVYLEMHDDEKNEVHIISADRIIFSENNDTVTAIGNISYILDRGDVQEIFTGERLTFNVDHWGGIFFDGVTEREEDIQEKSVRFRFSGKRIIRNSSEKILLENGTITSSKEVDPYYKIRSSKIWVFDKGEWVLEHPVVYVGRVPLLYFPFFFKQKNDLFFNPSFGIDDNGNAFFFSTYYLFGEKKKDEDGEFSFMNIGVSEEQAGPKRVREIFLVDDPDPSDFALSLYEWAKETDSYGKLMVDYYSMMGLFSSFDSNISTKYVKGTAWLGGSRSYFPYTENDSKSLFWPAPEPEPEPEDPMADPAVLDSPFIVNEYSWLNGGYVPYRFGIDVNYDVSIAGLGLGIKFPMYSDPYFRRVFDNRYETIQWGKILQLEDTGFEDIDLEEKNAAPLWKATADYNLNIPFLKPYVNILKISNLEASAQLREGTLNRTRYSDTEIAERIPDWEKISSSDITLYPGNYFYYLHSMNLPDVSASISGTLLGGSKKKTNKADEEADTFSLPEELKPPWDEADEDEEENGGNDFLPPEQGTDIAIKAFTAPKLFSHNLGYTFSPNYKREGYFNTSRFGSEDQGLYGAPWEIENDILYNRLFMKLNPVITYNVDLFDSMFQFQERVNVARQIVEFESNNQEIIPESTWEKFMKDEDTQTFTTTAHTFSSTFVLPVPEESTIVNKTTYTVTDEIYSYKYDSTEEEYIEKKFPMDKESITTSKISNTLNFKINDWAQSVYADYSFPPNLQKYTYNVNPSIGPVKFRLTHGREEIEEDDWEYLPLFMSLQSKLDFGLQLTQELTYDYGSAQIDEEEVYDMRTGKTQLSWSMTDPTINITNTFDYRFNTLHNEEKSDYFPYSNVTSLTLGAFTTSYTMKDQYGYTYRPPGTWEQSETMEMRPSSMSFKYTDEILMPMIWKNRISSSINLNTNTNIVFQKFSQSNFTFDATFKFKIEEFLNVSFTSKSENTAIYSYFPQFMDQLGKEPANVFTDLTNSFSFFDMQKRKQSNFKLNSLSFSLEHQMRDWVFSMTYEGIPEAETIDGYLVYDWTSNMTFLITWSPIPEIKREATYEDDEFSF